MRTRTIIATAALLAGMISAGPVTTPSVGSAPGGCVPLQVFTVGGTGYQGDPPDPHRLDVTTHQVTKRLVRQQRRGLVAVDQIAYSAVVGQPESYAASKREGIRRLRRAISHTADRCRRTEFALVGYSQGAAVAGDVAARIGHRRGPVAPRRIAIVGLIADPNRSPRDPSIGPPTSGKGVDDPRRRGGFGPVRKRVVQFCIPGDFICDTPYDHSLLDELVRLCRNDRDVLGNTGAFVIRKLREGGWPKFWKLAGNPGPIKAALLTARSLDQAFQTYVRPGKHLNYQRGDDAYRFAHGKTMAPLLAEHIRRAIPRR